MVDDFGPKWRPIGEHDWIVCDESLDCAVASLPFVVRAGIRAGKNYSFAQAERIKALAAGNRKKSGIYG